MSYWTQHIDPAPGDYVVSTAQGVGTYAAFGFGVLLWQFFMGYALFSSAVKASIRCDQLFLMVAFRFLYQNYLCLRYHSDCLKSLLRVPVSFFDTTPLGRVLNIFSKDIYTVDETLASTFSMYFDTLSTCVVTAVMITLGAPYFLVAVAPIGLVYRKVQVFYTPFATQIKRIDAVLRSPVFEHFSEVYNIEKKIDNDSSSKYFIMSSDSLLFFLLLDFEWRLIHQSHGPTASLPRVVF